MGVLGAVIKAKIERKRYTVGYECWLDDENSEVLNDFMIAITPVTTPPLVAEGAYAATDFKSVTTLLSQGRAGTFYTIAFIAYTNLGQTKRDDLHMQVT
jgi:hypothetical protein